MVSGKMMSVPEGLGKDKILQRPRPASSPINPLRSGLDARACAAFEILFSHVSGGELRQVLTSGGFSVPFLGWQSSVTVKGTGFGVGQTWFRALALPVLSA